MIRNLYYLTANRIPDYKAASVQQMRMCEAFQSIGLNVSLITRRYNDNTISGDVWKYYGVHTPFTLHQLSSLQNAPGIWSRIPKIGGLTATGTLLYYWTNYARKHADELRNGVFFAREIRMVAISSFLLRTLGVQVPTFFEMHRVGGASLWFHNFLHRMTGIVTISQAIKDAAIETYHIEPDKIRVEHDAVAIEEFQLEESTDELRQQLNLPSNGSPLIVFSGSLYPGRGGEELIQAMAHMPAGVRLVLVGGHPTDLERLQALSQQAGLTDKIQFVGHVPHVDVPKYIKAADILVAPYTMNIPTARFASPLKIFEYMAARKPMVVGHLPVLDEVLKDRYNCVMAKPGDADDLAAGLLALINNKELGVQIADNAYRDVQYYTWTKRAERIREFMNNRTQK